MLWYGTCCNVCLAVLFTWHSVAIMRAWQATNIAVTMTLSGFVENLNLNTVSCWLTSLLAYLLPSQWCSLFLYLRDDTAERLTLYQLENIAVAALGLCMCIFAVRRICNWCLKSGIIVFKSMILMKFNANRKSYVIYLTVPFPMTLPGHSRPFRSFGTFS